MNSSGSVDELFALASALCEETVSADQVARLETLVLADDDACRSYLHYLALHGTLCLNGQANVSELRRAALSSRPVAGRRMSAGGDKRPYLKTFVLDRLAAVIARPVAWSILGVGILFCGYIAFISWGLRKSELPSAIDVADRNVATIHASSDVKWSKETPANAKDARVQSGERLKIDSGFVELKLE